MKIIPQLSLFEENDFEELGDLERLQRVLAAIPDEGLIQRLNEIRGKGRNDWPVIGMVKRYSHLQRGFPIRMAARESMMLTGAGRHTLAQPLPVRW